MRINHFDCMGTYTVGYVNFVPIHSFIKNTSTIWNARNYVVFQLGSAGARDAHFFVFRFDVFLLFLDCLFGVTSASFIFICSPINVYWYRVWEITNEFTLRLLRFTTNENGNIVVYIYCRMYFVSTEHVICKHALAI